MNTNQTRRNKSNYGAVRNAALVLGISLCLTTGAAFARDLGAGRGGKGAGVRPGVGVGGVGAGAARAGAHVGVGVPGPAALPAGYHRTVAAGYTTVVRAGVTCRYVGGVYYKPVTYQGETVWVVVP